MCLCTGGDHKALHDGMPIIKTRIIRDDSLTKGESAYRDRVHGMTWREIFDMYGNGAASLAKCWAGRHKQSWPPIQTESGKARSNEMRMARAKEAREKDLVKLSEQAESDAVLFRKIMDTREDGDLLPSWLNRKISS